MMEIKFQENLGFQIDAINSVVGLFRSQRITHEDQVLIPQNRAVSNQMSIDNETLLQNLKSIQESNKITSVDKLNGMNFSIEMETGTGKTYVYLRTIFELYREYGFKKFIIVVPSVAIREGVLKNLNITKKHFREIYENVPYHYYEYDSKKMGMVRQFARGNTIEIMIITIDSFKADNNIMNQERDSFDGERPIDVIKQANPILILDEPQNMESEKAKKALSSMEALFTLRYSATHKNHYNLVYRLTPIDAHNKQLVKKIEVASVTDNDYNDAFLRCLDIKAESKGIKAVLEVNKKTNKHFKRKSVTVRNGNDLHAKTNNPDYSGFVITEINARHGFVKFANNKKITLGEEQGKTQKKIMEAQIEQTIEEHFRKHQNLSKKNIKPLSLFFIDKVDNYTLQEGFIRTTFEKTFERLKKNYPDFRNVSVKTVHSGYFSNKRTEKSISKDKDAFDLIMKQKERLLSPDEPVQFIFSHSALREGWDNPNVFNICTLNQTVSDMKKRQEIGRGMRLPVDTNGNRITDEEHILTVIANESYEEYVSKLQQEYVDEYGNEYKPPLPLDVRNRKKIKLKKRYHLNPEFKELWKRIAQKTKYAVNIDTDRLVEDCVNEINAMIKIDSIKINIKKVSLSLEEGRGVVTKFVGEGSKKLETKTTIPNLLERIADETNLTRTTVIKILCKIENLNLIFENPQEFITSCTTIIREKLADFLSNGIKYLKVEDWYKMELFEDIETYQNMIINANKTIYDGVIWESKVEKEFAEGLERREDVKMFIKMPRWFVVETPIGTYNPDWAIILDEKDQFGETKERLYFVTETKGTTDINNLRSFEKRKIQCAREHFKSIEAEYHVTDNPYDLR